MKGNVVVANSSNPFRRYLFRRDFLDRVQSKLAYQLRKITKNGFEDQKRLLEGQDSICIFDVGANIGQTALAYHRAFPMADIYSFEPYPEAYASLSNRVSGIPRIHTYSVALSDQTGQAKFHITKTSVMNSLITPLSSKPWSFGSAPKTIEVETDTVERFCERLELDEITALKLDVQGGELKVLSGAEHMLRSGRIKLIYLEILIAPLYKEQPSFLDLYKYLDRLGYSLFNVYDMHESRLGQLRWADAIFVSSQLKKNVTERLGINRCGW